MVNVGIEICEYLFVKGENVLTVGGELLGCFVFDVVGVEVWGTSLVNVLGNLPLLEVIERVLVTGVEGIPGKDKFLCYNNCLTTDA